MGNGSTSVLRTNIAQREAIQITFSFTALTTPHLYTVAVPGVKLGDFVSIYNDVGAASNTQPYYVGLPYVSSDGNVSFWVSPQFTPGDTWVSTASVGDWYLTVERMAYKPTIPLDAFVTL